MVERNRRKEDNDLMYQAKQKITLIVAFVSLLAAVGGPFGAFKVMDFRQNQTDEEAKKLQARQDRHEADLTAMKQTVATNSALIPTIQGDVRDLKAGQDRIMDKLDRIYNQQARSGGNSR